MSYSDNKIVELITNSELFKESFFISISDKISITGYLEIDTYFQHYTAPERRKLVSLLNNDDLVYLMSKSFFDSEYIDKLESINKIDISEIQKNNLLTPEIAKAIISWALYCNKQRNKGTILKKLGGSQKKYEYIDEKYIIRKDIQYKIVDNLCSYIQVILDIKSNNNIFYRGHECLNYWIKPSIGRTENLYLNESKLYQELILRCPQDFNICKAHIDYLVEMQHYGLPTRLIDITSNPLVALYFASLGKPHLGAGEVIVFDVSNENFKYERSDTVTIISCLPLFDYGEQKKLLKLSSTKDIDSFNKDETVLRLLHEIRTEKPAFKERIKPEDLRRNIVVTPALKNNRISKQAGAFIITGLADYNSIGSSIENLRFKDKGQQLLIIVENKKRIKRELESVGINYASLFPEIDDVATYLKDTFENDGF